jgi:site-specific recombinase XerD
VKSLPVQAVDFKGKMLRTRGKGDKDRVISLTRELHELLKQVCRNKSTDELVVGLKDKGIYGVVKKYASLAGETDFHPHDLRHAFAGRFNPVR